ncbi:cAMP-binding domain of CRP or a regulatory subunit of cAMP-dependent protein kinases [Roseateles sp. YR242]|nr:cAMP-binding domain of CRP or a regulatory subunit of cAMP-dependent protein kinases [Roseateles sp. YR242]
MPLGDAIVSTPLAQRLIDWPLLLGGLALPEASRQLLNSMVGLRSLRQGAAIYRHGQAPTHLYAVCQGAAGLGRNRRGRADVLMQSFQLRRTVQEGHWLDLHTAWLGCTHELDACALTTPTLIMEWPIHLARPWLTAQPDVVMALMREMAAQVHIFNTDLHDLLSKNALCRVAGWLMRRAGPHTRFQMDERKRDVAAQLAVSAETFSRMMRQLEQRGLVQVDGYDILLLDRIALIRLARDH